jgi:DNA-binding MarR family transcriptional regulator
MKRRAGHDYGLLNDLVRRHGFRRLPHRHRHHGGSQLERRSTMTEKRDLDLEDTLLTAMLMPDQSIPDLACACGWRTSKVQRVLKRLEKDKLVVTTKRGVATLTNAGKTAANKIKAAEDHLATLKAIKDHSEFDEHEIEFGRAAVAMLADGYEPARCHWLVTCAMIAFRQMAAVQAKRNALRVVDDVPPGDRRPRCGRRPPPSSPHLVQS